MQSMSMCRSANTQIYTDITILTGVKARQVMESLNIQGIPWPVKLMRNVTDFASFGIAAVGDAMSSTEQDFVTNLGDALSQQIMTATNESRQLLQIQKSFALLLQTTTPIIPQLGGKCVHL